MDESDGQFALIRNKEYYVPLTLRGELIKETKGGKVIRRDTINNYEIVCSLGEGAFSKVYKVKFVRSEGT